MEKISGSGEQPQNTGENGKSIPKSAYEQVFFEQLRSGVEYDESKLSDEQLEAYKAAKKSYEKTKAINKERKQEHDKKLLKKITAGALVAMIGTGVKAAKDSGVFNGIKLNSDDPMVEVFAEENPAGTAEAAKDNEVVDVKELTGNEKLDALIDGSFEQYDNVGLYKYEMDKKFTDNAVSNPKAILEYMGVNPEEATAEDYGQAYEYVVYSQKESAAFVAVANGFEGFDKLSYEQGEQKIANMTAEEKEDFQDQLKEHFDDTTYEFETGKGMGTNHFIKQHEDGSTYGVWITDDETGIEHVNIKHAEENGGYEITYAQVRCFNTGKKIIIVHSDGSIEETEIYTETPPEEVTPPGDTPNPNPDPDNPDNPDNPDDPDDPGNQSKNTEAEKKNAGPVVTPMELNEDVTPPTTIEQDQANLEAIRQQQEAERAATEQAARVAAEQAERERQAAAEAEQRRQAEAAQARAAEEAAAQARAEEQARAAQAAAAEAERQAAARAAEEAAAREAAQREAEARAAAEQSNAEAVSDNNESRDAVDFANGAFDLNS